MVADSSPTASEGFVLSPGDQVVHVDITVPPGDTPMPHAALSLVQDPSPTPAKSVSSSSAYEWVEPRSLRDINPTVTFSSFSPLPLFSTCSVYRGDPILHIDQPTLMGVREDENTYLHYTSLAPGYWDSLCRCTGPPLSFDALLAHK